MGINARKLARGLTLTAGGRCLRGATLARAAPAAIQPEAVEGEPALAA